MQVAISNGGAGAGPYRWARRLGLKLWQFGRVVLLAIASVCIIALGLLLYKAIPITAVNIAGLGEHAPNTPLPVARPHSESRSVQERIDEVPASQNDGASAATEPEIARFCAIANALATRQGKTDPEATASNVAACIDASGADADTCDYPEAYAMLLRLLDEHAFEPLAFRRTALNGTVSCTTEPAVPQ